MLGQKAPLGAQPWFHSRVVAIEGPMTYKIEVRVGSYRLCAADQLRRYYAPLVARAWPMHYTRHKSDEWICDKIVGFRPQDPKKKDGIPQWKAHWQGFPKSHDSWEPASSFLPNFHPGWVEYCRGRNISLDLKTSFPREGNIN